MREHHFENIGWTVGNHCNARCGHCYSWQVRKDSREFLTKSDIDRVISQLKKFGVKTVNLGGNEPIYTHGSDLSATLLPYIIRSLYEAEIPVGLTTNGVSFTWLDKYYHEELLMINDIDFSLDSPFEKEHDLNRGNKLYRLVVEAIQRSVELGIDCSVIACGMKKNFTKEYLSSYLALTKMLGCEFRINTLKPVEPSLIDQMPTPEQFYQGFAFLMNNSSCVTLGESCLTAFTETGTKGCPCGHTSFRINAKTKDGRIPINPCVYTHEYKAGDLLKEELIDIVTGPEFTTFALRKNHIPKECRDSNCSFLESCRGGCTARSFFINHNLDAKDPYCPQDYLDKHGSRPDLPIRPEIGCHDGIRVHDNYLCTWIGEVSENFHDARYTSVTDFYQTEKNNIEHMSEHFQVQEGKSSLVTVDNQKLKLYNIEDNKK